MPELLVTYLNLPPPLQVPHELFWEIFPEFKMTQGIQRAGLGAMSYEAAEDPNRVKRQTFWKGTNCKSPKKTFPNLIAPKKYVEISLEIMIAKAIILIVGFVALKYRKDVGSDAARTLVNVVVAKYQVQIN